MALVGSASRALRSAAEQRGIELVEASGERDALDAGLAAGIRAGAWPAALARLHAALCDDAVLFAAPGARAWLEGAGFRPGGRQRGAWLRARRLTTLPDFVRPDLDLLICGLNPSLHAASSGVPFSRPGNRFWPAALRARLVERDRDPLAALERGVGFTDFCKRATRRAGELRPAEYARGVARLEALVRRLQPRALCFVGLEGWRRTLDRAASPGWVPGGFADCPAYLMPSTSGLNAHANLAQLTAHLANAYTGRAYRPA